jgi:long-chain acyl-CoA synthetase
VKIGSIGIPVPGTDLACLDEESQPVPAGTPGEIAARGPQVMRGYWRRPEDTEEALRDGWFRTGDIGVMEPDGFFTIVDRKKDMICVSGFNVYPNEVEACLAAHPGILEAAVVGDPHPETGEMVRAVVVPRDRGLDEDAVRRHCRAHLTAYKVPRRVEFVDTLPKSNVGKILRKELRGEGDASGLAAA